MIFVQIFRGHAVCVRGCDFLDLGGVFVEPVGWVPVELIGHAFAENLVGRVETEDERVKNRVFGALEFIVGKRMLFEVVDVFLQCLDRFDRGLTFRTHHDLQNLRRKLH